MGRKVDVVVLGSGFGGSLAGILLDRIGLSCMIVEQGAHPRFAIGESATPTADFVLREMAARHDLPWLDPLTRYGPWCRTYPEIRRGLKRGFSYFAHSPGEAFHPDPDHSTELLVTANRDDEHADTQWLRSDVDHFLVRQALAQGIPVQERTRASVRRTEDGWSLELKANRETGAEEDTVQARFLVDASGEAMAVAGALGLSSDTSGLKTCSRTIFGHFEGVTPWHEVLADLGGQVEEHPFRSDHAAQHHVLEQGWMWQLRFDHGVTSVGLVLDAADHPLDPSVPVEEEWTTWIGLYPSLAGQLAGAHLVAPEDGLRRTGRLQRRVPQTAGEGWALLPGAAGFIDPLHSTGIAQTLCGVERLVTILQEHGVGPESAPALRWYDRTVQEEIRFVDELVSGCYRARVRFRLFAAFSMLYFAAATTYEHRRLEGRLQPGSAFLCADDAGLRAATAELGDRLRALLRDGLLDDGAVSGFETEVARRLEPFNQVGLCDPSARNLYRYTAVP